MQYKVIADISNGAGNIVIPANTIVEAGPVGQVQANGNYNVTFNGIEVVVNGERIAIEQSLIVALQNSGNTPAGQATVPMLPTVPCPQYIRAEGYCEVADNIGYMVANNRSWQYAALAVIVLALYGLYTFISPKSA